MNDINMNRKSFLYWKFFFIMLLSVSLSACTGKTGHAKHLADSIRNRQSDSSVVAGIATHTEQACSVIDSLEEVEAVSPQRISYYRALTYYKIGDRQNTEKYLVKALDGNKLLVDNRELFYRSADLLASSMINRHEYKKALAVATLGFEASKADQSQAGRRWVALLLNAMGYCEMQLGHIDAAERCFSQAYIALKQMVDVDPNYANLQDYARLSCNTLDAYVSTRQYKKAAAWLESTEEAVNLLVASPECTKNVRERWEGGLYAKQALVLLHTGNRAGADAAFAKVMKLNYGQTGQGIIEFATYLKEAGRTDELLHLLPQVDSVYTSWGDSKAANELH